jgi:hypothetical protein
MSVKIIYNSAISVQRTNMWVARMYKRKNNENDVGKKNTSEGRNR